MAAHSSQGWWGTGQGTCPEESAGIRGVENRAGGSKPHESVYRPEHHGAHRVPLRGLAPCSGGEEGVSVGKVRKGGKGHVGEKPKKTRRPGKDVNADQSIWCDNCKTKGVHKHVQIGRASCRERVCPYV